MKKFKVVSIRIENSNVRVCRERRPLEFKIRWYYNVSDESITRVKKVGHGYTPYHKAGI